MKIKMPSPAARRWAYGVLTAGVPLLVAYGVVEASVAPLWVAAGGAVLGFGLAAANTPPTGRHRADDE